MTDEVHPEILSVHISEEPHMPTLVRVSGDGRHLSTAALRAAAERAHPGHDSGVGYLVVPDALMGDKAAELWFTPAGSPDRDGIRYAVRPLYETLSEDRRLHAERVKAELVREMGKHIAAVRDTGRHDGVRRMEEGAPVSETTEWHCEAYGAEGAAMGLRCFFAAVRGPCALPAECAHSMAAERERAYNKIQELAAGGDETAIYLASQFSSPDQLLNADRNDRAD